MKKMYCLLTLLMWFILYAEEKLETPYFKADTQWTIVGAGPAGIVCVGLLLDIGVAPKDIYWIDPEFNVGRIGKYYQNVPANVPTQVFIDFLNACRIFRECAACEIEELLQLDLNREHPLEVIVKPLQVITQSCSKKVNAKKSHLHTLDFQDDVWHVGIENERFTSAHVILATGCKPKVLDYACKTNISLDLALDKNTLATLVHENDTIGVIGSAHSAILILKYLSEINVGRVFNFYLHEPNFHHPEYGLGGATAEWAKNVMLKSPPANLIRLYNKPEILKAWLPLITKIIYAAGFERDTLPTIHCDAQLNFNDPSGIIAPRLFGIGIAFPEKYQDEDGKIVSKIGLSNFMDYAQRILPSWMQLKDAYSRFISFEDFFAIIAL